ncbi:hypothetical protein JXB41_07770 [Candidatus Woesearchaeota archaeon]|nr:hypothetical protein [Candidatus Woesearchaeota archaeon]
MNIEILPDFRCYVFFYFRVFVEVIFIIKYVSKIKNGFFKKNGSSQNKPDEKIDIKINSLENKLILIKKDLLKRDLLYNLSRIRQGDIIISFMRSGGGLISFKKNHLSIKKLDELFGYYDVNNKIILQRHKTIKQVLQKYGLIQEENLVEATFKTDTYFINKDQKLKNVSKLRLQENIQISKLSEKKIYLLFNLIIDEIKKDMIEFVGQMLEKKNLSVNNPVYDLSCGFDRVKRVTDINLLFEKKYYEWNQFFWQRIAKSNSMKAAVIADLNSKQFMIFSKEKFDNIIEEINVLNEKLIKENKGFMKKYWRYWIIKKDVVKQFNSICTKQEFVKYHTALEYFERLKILEEIITYPLSYSEAVKSLNRTAALIKDIDKSLQFLEKCKIKIHFGAGVYRKLEQIEVLSTKALENLHIDYKNPEFNSDIKFFSETSDLKVGKYYFIYIDIKDAGLKIRKWHEKKILQYHSEKFRITSFLKLCFYSYDEFITLIRKNQNLVKRICEKHLKKQEILYLAFGDEIFVLIPHTHKTTSIINEIKKKIDVDVRIVSTYFDINKQINELGTGRQVINAFDAIKFGDKIIKYYERTTEKFNRIVLIDPNYSHKVLDELGESVEDI